MVPFRLFLSHCDDSPAHPIVRPLYELLTETFQADIRGGALEILYDGRDPVPPGVPLRAELVRKVAQCDLVLACATRRWRQAPYFVEEVKAAIAAPVPIIPVLLLGPSDDVLSFQLGDLHPDLEDHSGRLMQVALTLRVEGSDDPSGVRDAIRTQVGSILGGTLISQIRTAFIARARRDLSLYDNQNQLLEDLAQQSSPYIKIFMYDGGTTINRLAHNHEVLDRMRDGGRALSLQFLYVDTDFKKFVCESPQVLARPELEQLEPSLYAALYEALVRRSGMVHNDDCSPNGHAAAVTKSVRLLQGIAQSHGLGLEVRKTSHLPFFRMILTRYYVYYTHFLPTVGGGDTSDPAPEFHSLRLAANSPAGKALGAHFDRLWKQAEPITLGNVL